MFLAPVREQGLTRIHVARRDFFSGVISVVGGVTVQLDVMLQLGFELVTRPYDFVRHRVDFEALVEENPDFVLLDDTSFPSAFFSCDGEAHELWKDVRAIAEGRFAVAPALMHSILGSAIFAQSIGMLWMASVIPPLCFGCDMATEMVSFYRLFYGLERDETSMARLLGMAVNDE